MIRGPWGRRRQIFYTCTTPNQTGDISGCRDQTWPPMALLKPLNKGASIDTPSVLIRCPWGRQHHIDPHTPSPLPSLISVSESLFFGALFLLKKRLSVLAKSDPDPYPWPMDPDPQNWRDVSIIWKCYMSAITQVMKLSRICKYSKDVQTTWSFTVWKEERQIGRSYPKAI